jgi:hypothetical protein
MYTYIYPSLHACMHVTIPISSLPPVHDHHHNTPTHTHTQHTHTHTQTKTAGRHHTKTNPPHTHTLTHTHKTKNKPKTAGRHRPHPTRGGPTQQSARGRLLLLGPAATARERGGHPHVCLRRVSDACGHRLALPGTYIIFFIITLSLSLSLYVHSCPALCLFVCLCWRTGGKRAYHLPRSPVICPLSHTDPPPPDTPTNHTHTYIHTYIQTTCTYINTNRRRASPSPWPAPSSTACKTSPSRCTSPAPPACSKLRRRRCESWWRWVSE